MVTSMFQLVVSPDTALLLVVLKILVGVELFRVQGVDVGQRVLLLLLILTMVLVRVVLLAILAVKI